MRLEPLYRVRFRSAEAWFVELERERRTESQHFFIAEGRCEGTISGRFRGANPPHRRTDLTYLPEFQGVIETDDGAKVMFDYRGYGRAYPEERRPVVGTGVHVSGDEPYSRLNDVVCVICGEARPLPEGAGFSIVLDVQEPVWEPPGD